MKLTVIATFRFEGFHRWPDAPPEVGFLANRHRHVFQVRLEKRVEHEDRDREFILLARLGADACARLHTTEPVETWSCEAWAARLVEILDVDACEVWEDGENGARAER